MTGELNILIFTTIFLLFNLTNCQPSTSNPTRETLQKHCHTDNGSLIRLTNMNYSVSLTELLIRPMWSSVDWNYTPWIAYIGCYEINILPQVLKQHQLHNLNNTVEGCYLECQKENISCGQNELIYFALKESKSLCFWFCKIQELSNSNECNESCTSNEKCRRDNYFSVYAEYAIENKGSERFCLFCSNADKIPDANLSDFGCDGEPFGMCVTVEDNCYGMKEDNGNLNFSNRDCEQHLPYNCQKYNVQSSEPSSKYPHEVSSSIPFQHSSHSPASIDNATASSTDTVEPIVGLLLAVFAMSSLVLFLGFYKTNGKGKHRDFHIDLHQPQTSQTVSNTYTDMMIVSGANQTQNDVTFTTTTNDVRNDDIYVENEEGEYDHLHSSRPQQVISEREDERYATSTQLEDVTYSTVRKSRKSVPDRDNKNDSMAASLDNSFLSVANPDYDFCYQFRQRKD